MREDIAKKLCERPRYGGGGKYNLRSDRRKSKEDRNWDSLPKKESMKRPNIRGWNGKYLNEYFAPLLGFLKKRVGRPWSKVFSEISEHLNPSTAVQKHVFDHLLRDFVVEKPIFDGKVPHDPDFSYKGKLREVSRFFVDRQGILQDNDSDKARARRNRKYRKRRSPVQRKRISSLEDYRKIEGVWYHVWYEPLRHGQRRYDVILDGNYQAGQWGCGQLEQSNGEIRLNDEVFPLVAVRKVQISKKEIRREGLNQL